MTNMMKLASAVAMALTLAAGAAQAGGNTTPNQATTTGIVAPKDGVVAPTTHVAPMIFALISSY